MENFVLVVLGNAECYWMALTNDIAFLRQQKQLTILDVCQESSIVQPLDFGDAAMFIAVPLRKHEKNGRGNLEMYDRASREVLKIATSMGLPKVCGLY